MAGQILGGSPLGGAIGGLNPLSNIMGATAPGQMNSGFSSLVPMLAQGLKGALGAGPNPTVNPMSQPTNNAPLPVVGGLGYGSQGGVGNQGQNMVSQDERSTMADRLGLPMNVPPPVAGKGTAQPISTGTPPPTAVHQATATDPYSIPPAIRAGIFKGESGGDYNTLYGHIERNGPFAGTKLTNMTVDQALAFNAPNGPYGSWAASKGIAAAPLGAYQIVHRTLRDAKAGLGLKGDELMTPALQERLGGWIYRNQGTGAWAGYHGPGDPNAYASAPADASLPFAPGETLHVPSNRRGGGSGRQDPNIAYAGGVDVTLPGGSGPGGSFGVADGNDNTATTAGQSVADQQQSRAKRMAALAGSPGGVGPQLPQTRPPMQDQNNPAYQQVQANRNSQHSRALPAVDVMKGLASIGKGYRDNAGSTYG